MIWCSCDVTVMLGPGYRTLSHMSQLTIYFVGLVQERRNSIANALELRLSCTNPSIWPDDTVHPQPFVHGFAICSLLWFDTAQFYPYPSGSPVARFYTRPVLALGYCRYLRLSHPSVHPSVHLSVTKFVSAITHYPFKLGSPNLDHRCKRQ